jgi:hypothetical protein
MNNLPLRLLVLAVLCHLATSTYAQEGVLDLQVEPNFTPIPLGTKRNTVIFIDADRLDAQSEKTLKATGNALLRQRGAPIRRATSHRGQRRGYRCCRGPRDHRRRKAM